MRNTDQTRGQHSLGRAAVLAIHHGVTPAPSPRARYLLILRDPDGSYDALVFVSRAEAERVGMTHEHRASFAMVCDLDDFVADALGVDALETARGASLAERS